MTAYQCRNFLSLREFEKWIEDNGHSIVITSVFVYGLRIEAVYAERSDDPTGAILELLTEGVKLLQSISSFLYKTDNRVTGGVMARIGDTMLPIQPGSSPQFQVTPTFSGAPFALVAAQAAVSSSDTTNFPVALNTSDPTGTIFTAAIPSSAVIPSGGESVTVTWTYTNVDGTVATVTGTVTENGIDDVTGGTFAQVA